MNSSGASVHRAVPRPSVAAVVLEAEGDATVIEADQPAVGDGDAVGIASEIGEHRLGPRKRGLAVDKPVLLPQRREIGGKGRPAAQAVELAEEHQSARRVRVGEPRQEEPPEQAGQHAHW